MAALASLLAARARVCRPSEREGEWGRTTVARRGIWERVEREETDTEPVEEEREYVRVLVSGEDWELPSVKVFSGGEEVLGCILGGGAGVAAGCWAEVAGGVVRGRGGGAVARGGRSVDPGGGRRVSGSGGHS